ncbi:predicted GPI-anchored protein 58 [Heterocephalus glaber]|uniref:Predicted GPI-anchored protein 58 n=1 Tax=Heterocephalus glaber TaxID=10181 RepID=A0AAX6S570_HETGA|nr:predicted GPI-anchored protein 58 [Heterocephalus glaber]
MPDLSLCLLPAFLSSTSSSLDSLLERHTQVYTVTYLLNQVEQDELTEAEAKGAAPVQAEVPPAEPVPAPPAAASPALAPQPERAPGSPSPPAGQLGQMVAPQQVSAPDLPLGQAPAPHWPFPSIIVALVFSLTFALICWIYVNDRLIFK